MSRYQHVKVPAGGQKITVNQDYSLNVPDQPDHPLHRGRRHRARHHAGDDQGRRRGGGEGLRRQAQDPLDGDLRRREVDQGLRPRRVAARGDAGDPQGVRGVDQGAADHAGGRRHPLAQRGAAPGAGPVCLPAPGALLQGRAQPGQGAGEDRHGDLPRELGGHLRRHRVGGRVRRGEEGHRLPDQGDGRQEDPLSRRPRASASSRCRAKAPSGWCARRSSTRSTTTAVGDAGAQGQHHEVHRGRLPRLGLRAGAEGVRRAAARRRPVDARSRTRRPAARSSSRT